MRRTPAYTSKNTNYESVAELHMVAGMTAELLYGEDANLNGLLDMNENDGETAAPYDNHDGRLDPGYLEYFTVFTRVPTLGTNINDQASLQALLETKLNASRVQQLNLRPAGGAPGGGGAAQQFNNLLEFYYQSGMTRDEFAQVEGFLVCTNATNALININTASQAVLRCIPGIGADSSGTDLTPKIISYRMSNPNLNTIAWLGDALSWTWQDNRAQIQQVGPWVCGRAFQFSADIAAVGHHGRGFKRVKYIFDVADGYAQVRYRQDLTYLGWALGKQVRDTVMLASDSSRRR
jgi:DNA uptake protein ComE-like DNA-binding protein